MLAILLAHVVRRAKQRKSHNLVGETRPNASKQSASRRTTCPPALDDTPSKGGPSEDLLATRSRRHGQIFPNIVADVFPHFFPFGRLERALRRQALMNSLRLGQRA